MVYTLWSKTWTLRQKFGASAHCLICIKFEIRWVSANANFLDVFFTAISGISLKAALQGVISDAARKFCDVFRIGKIIQKQALVFGFLIMIWKKPDRHLRASLNL